MTDFAPIAAALASGSTVAAEAAPDGFRLVIAMPSLEAAQAAQRALLPPAVQPPALEPAVEVKSTVELLAALKAAKGGDVLRLKPGPYAKMTLKSLKYDGQVRLLGAGALLGDLQVRDCEGLAFEGVTLVVKEGGEPNQFAVMTSARIAFASIEVRGGEGRPFAGVGGLMLRQSKDVSVTGSKFSGVQHGLTILDNDGVTITGNDFRDLQTDGVRGGGNSNVVITGNAFTDFYPAPGDHPDAIQLWTTSTKASARNIKIAANVITRGAGLPMQGIFLRDQVKTLPYIDVEIADNIVLGGMFNGVMIEGGQGARISRNVVAGFPDQKSWIRMDRVGGLEMTGNEAEQFLADGKAIAAPKDNAAITPATDGGQALLAAFRS